MSLPDTQATNLDAADALLTAVEGVSLSARTTPEPEPEQSGLPDRAYKLRDTVYPHVPSAMRKLLSTLIDHNAAHDPVPELQMTGTVKLNGIYGAILLWEEAGSLGRGEGRIEMQGRDGTTLSPESDFAAFVQANEKDIRELFGEVVRRWGDVHTNMWDRTLNFDLPVLLAGEWIGQGLSEGVAVSKLDRRVFVIHSIQMNACWEHLEEYKSVLPDGKALSNILLCEPKRLAIRLDDDGAGFMEAAGKLAVEYEARCPFGEVLGIDGKGEGLVWVPSLYQSTGKDKVSMLPEFWVKTVGPGFGKTVLGEEMDFAGDMGKVEEEGETGKSTEDGAGEMLGEGETTSEMLEGMAGEA